MDTHGFQLHDIIVSKAGHNIIGIFGYLGLVRPVGRGGACAPPFQTEIYKQQYAKWCLQDPNLRSLATH